MEHRGVARVSGAGRSCAACGRRRRGRACRRRPRMVPSLRPRPRAPAIGVASLKVSSSPAAASLSSVRRSAGSSRSERITSSSESCHQVRVELRAAPCTEALPHNRGASTLSRHVLAQQRVLGSAAAPSAFRRPPRAQTAAVTARTRSRTEPEIPRMPKGGNRGERLEVSFSFERPGRRKLASSTRCRYSRAIRGDLEDLGRVTRAELLAAAQAGRPGPEAPRCRKTRSCGAGGPAGVLR